MSIPFGRRGSPNKYRNKKTVVDGIEFSSKKEARWYIHYSQLEKRGDIKNLELQPRFKFPINGENVRYLESKREITYIADFKFKDQDGNEHVVDAKGFKTPDYKIKRALMKAVHGIEVQEV